MAGKAETKAAKKEALKAHPGAKLTKTQIRKLHQRLLEEFSIDSEVQP